jgi:hypothetical protein
VLKVQGQQIEYTLFLQKQPGTRAVPIHVQVRFPEGMTLVSSAPVPASQTLSALDYVLALETDQILRVVFAGPGRGL